ncbi:HNH endonuclease [Streptomyces sp. NPDC007872]|uniref:HNH endonuclease n=1 Tax=Streptomyces sp. NPDC007872 TaxID=3364782 RepID=UPI0036D086F7
MTIDGVGQSNGETVAGGGIQWLLQPRGIRKGGRAHFRHTVQEGVNLADYEHLLGEEAAKLAELFPKGSAARFWGATPAASEGNTKGQALRNCRVGDEVLFYNQWKFIARATITEKFRNTRLAEALWGKDEEDGAAWEHMIALGDVVEFQVDARPVLAAFGINGALRSLRLESAEKRRAFIDEHGVPWSAPATTAGLPTLRRSTVVSPSKLERQALLHAFGALRTHTRQDGPSPHKPLALLWSIGRVAAGAERLAPWDVFEHEVGTLLTEFGGGSQATPHYPFSHLRSSGVWELEGIADDIKDPGPRALRAAGARAGFVADAAALLRKARVRAEAVKLLSSRYFPAAVRPLVLDRVGLGGYLSASGGTEEVLDEATAVIDGVAGPVKRRPVTGTRPERNPDLIKQVKEWHQDTCQVCSEPLEVLVGHYSEAAHIQGIGSPHDGPDQLSNMLCLCPNHHKQFDRLAIYIDPEWRVRRTRDDEVLYELRFDPRHRIEPERVEYHRVLCGKND